MTLHLNNAGEPWYVGCDTCECAASPGPVDRGGHPVEWLKQSGVPPNWNSELSGTVNLTHHYCPRCTRKREANK